MSTLIDRMEHAEALDRVGDPLRGALRRLLPERLRRLLQGTWLGHPLHPALVHAPIGAWMSTAVLDALPGQERAATTLLAAGTAAALPTALSGSADWTTLSTRQRRIGLVHAGANAVALTLFGASLAARLRGRHDRGRALTLAGLAVAGGSAYLGGVLAYSRGAGVDQRVSGPQHPSHETEVVPAPQSAW